MSEGAGSAEPQARKIVYCGDAIAASMSTLSVDAQKRAAKDAAKKEAKAAAAESKAAEKRETSKVLIKRIERNKRKYVTAVSGLEAFGLDLKKVSKDFGKKFATGSSVTKVPSGGEEITVQGDLTDEIFELLVEGDGYKGVIPEDNVDCIEDKKKKSAS
ncbi:MAG: Translation machinery-associated protein 22 [Stictis urceolatum]|nr:Translation machinery-associated protein 22 [Stictis urceolata]